MTNLALLPLENQNPIIRPMKEIVDAMNVWLTSAEEAVIEDGEEVILMTLAAGNSNSAITSGAVVNN